jgi:hypothetical protein
MLSEPEPSDTLTNPTVNMADQSADIKPILALKELVASLYWRTKQSSKSLKFPRFCSAEFQ